MADDLAANHFAILFAGNDLDETFGLVDRHRLAIGSERHPPDLHLNSMRHRISLAPADAGYFWFTINTSWNGKEIETWFSNSGHDLNRGDTFGRGFMRQ